MKSLLKALITRHSIVVNRIAEEQGRPLPDTLRVRSLKKLRLKLKDQIEHLQRAERVLAVPPAGLMNR